MTDAPTLRWWPYVTEDLTWHEVPFGRRAGAEVGPSCAAVVAIGAFDGLHRGHQKLLSAAREEARERGALCVAVTFDPDPSELVAQSGDVRGARPGSRLLGCEDRAAGLIALGADAVVSLRFDDQMARRMPASFVGDVLMSLCRPVSVHVGDNFRFGKEGRGDVRTLEGIGNEMGFCCHAHSLLSVDSAVVSATRVRHAVIHGDLEAVGKLLGRCHYVRGVVSHGRGEGTGFGFPTANVMCDVVSCLPPDGVYACYVTCGRRGWPAAVNVGNPPTFDVRNADGRVLIEANLLGFDGDLYGSEACVSFVRWLRPSRRFASVEELESVVLSNIAWVGEHLGNCEREVARD